MTANKREEKSKELLESFRTPKPSYARLRSNAFQEGETEATWEQERGLLQCFLLKRSLEIHRAGKIDKKKLEGDEGKDGIRD